MSSFSDEITAEASLLAQHMTADVLAGRPAADGMTIDGPRSKDLDDAIWLERSGSGFVVHVSIADVAALVQPGTKMYDEALCRVATQYRARSNVPMLPELLSENLLSLLPDLPRPAITFSISLSSELEPEGFSFRKTSLRSKRRLTYAEVDSIIENGEGDDHRDILRSAFAIAEALMGRRRMRGALVIYDLFKRVYTTEEGYLIPLDEDRAHKGHIIVQEFMILCNSSVAHFMASQGIPFLFRNHTVRTAAPVREEIMEQLRTAVLHPRLLEVVRQRTLLWYNRATYDPVLKGHYALNEAAYAHATSPIRRSADLINQHILSAYLDGSTQPFSHEELTGISSHINKRLEDFTEATRQHHKGRAHAVTRAKLDGATIAELLSLSAKELQQILKHASLMAGVPEGIDHVVLARIEDNTLGPEHLYAILFQSPKHVPSWQNLRSRCLSYLEAHSEHAASLVHMHAQEGHLVDVRIEDLTHADGFGARVVVTKDGARHSTPSTAVSSSKKGAHHIACVLFIQHYLNGTLVNVAAADQNEHGTQESDDLDGGGAPSHTLEAENFVGKLAELCTQRETWHAPAYTFAQSGPPHQVTITCACSLNAGGRTLKTTAKASSKKSAKHRAAAQMLEIALQEPAEEPETHHEETAPVQFEELPGGDNYVGLLEELVTQRRIVPRPAYEFAITGPEHKPVVTCVATLVVDGRSLRADGVSPTKKDAKQIAACKLLKIINDSPLPAEQREAPPEPEENYIGRLIELIQKNVGWSGPVFDVESFGTSNQPRFICTCRVNVGDECLEVKASAWQKQASRHAAARAVLEQVLRRTDSLQIQGTENPDDDVARLTNFCNERSFPLPMIDVEEWENTSAPAYSCKAKIRLGERIHEAASVGATKPEALQAACRELLALLKSGL